MIIVLFLVILLGLILNLMPKTDAYKYKQIRLTYIILISTILTLQSGLRNIAVGPDTYAYFLKFESVTHTSWSEIAQTFIDVYLHGKGKGAGYPLLQKIFQIFSESYRYFLISVAIFFFYSFSRFVYKNTSTIAQAMFAYVLYLALFYSFFSVNGIRQAIATGIILLAYEYVKERKLKPFLLACFIAIFLHKSSIIFMLVYPLYQVKNVKLLYLATAISAMIAFLFRQPILQFFYTLYYNEQSNRENSSPATTFPIMMALIFVFIVYNLFYSKKKLTAETLGMVSISSIAFVFTPTVGTNSETMRIVQYFSLFFVILLPSLFYTFSKKTTCFCYISSILLLSTVILLKEAPYAFFWQPMKLPPNYSVQIITHE